MRRYGRRFYLFVLNEWKIHFTVLRSLCLVDEYLNSRLGGDSVEGGGGSLRRARPFRVGERWKKASFVSSQM